MLRRVESPTCTPQTRKDPAVSRKGSRVVSPPPHPHKRSVPRMGPWGFLSPLGKLRQGARAAPAPSRRCQRRRRQIYGFAVSCHRSINNSGPGWLSRGGAASQRLQIPPVPPRAARQPREKPPSPRGTPGPSAPATPGTLAGPTPSSTPKTGAQDPLVQPQTWILSPPPAVPAHVCTRLGCLCTRVCPVCVCTCGWRGHTRTHRHGGCIRVHAHACEPGELARGCNLGVHTHVPGSHACARVSSVCT